MVGNGHQRPTSPRPIPNRIEDGQQQTAVYQQYNSLTEMSRRNCKLQQFTTLEAKLTCARFSKKRRGEQQRHPDQHEYFVTGDDHNNIRFYEFLGERQLHCFNSHNGPALQIQVSAVAVSCDEGHLFSGSNRGVINVWDLLEPRNAPSCTLKGHATPINCFGVFPEESEKRMASSSYDTHIRLWDVRQKSSYALLKHHSKQINWLDISPDGCFLLSSSEDCTTKFWDLRATEKVLSTYAEHSGPVLKAMFNPEDCLFASCSTDRTVKYFNCDEGKGTYAYVSSTEPVSAPITAIDFSLDGALVCSAGNNCLQIWDMRRDGLLLQSIDCSWRRVQDILWCEKGIKGLSCQGGDVSVWFCHLGQENANQRESQDFRGVIKSVSERKKSVSFEQRKPKHADVHKNTEQRCGGVGRDNGERKGGAAQWKWQGEQRPKYQELIGQEQRKQKLRALKEKDTSNKQKETREINIATIYDYQTIKQVPIDMEMPEKHNQEHQHKQQLNKQKSNEVSLQHDLLENSQVMDFSAFIGNASQKDRLLQLETIAELMKENGRFQSVYKMKSNYVKPIIHYWKQGKIESAMYTLSQADSTVAHDCISAILRNSTFKMGIAPDVACGLVRKLTEIMGSKHSTYVKNSMGNLNEIVLMFKDELIKIKMFSSAARVDLTREERMAKYDRLTEQLLTTFRNERLQKYAGRQCESQELHLVAVQLHRNLEQVLKKILPRGEPEAA